MWCAMVHCPICCYTPSMCAWNVKMQTIVYGVMQRRRAWEKVTSVPIWRFCGCDKWVWVQTTHTLSPHSHHPAWLCDLIMPPFTSSPHSKEYVRERERPRLFGVIVLLFCASCGRLNIFLDCICPQSDLTLVVPTYFLSQVEHIC